MRRRRVIVGFSGGVTSAWCLGWALRNYPREEVVALWHDTKEEHPDTYRFLREMAAALQIEITERSDGRSVTQLFRDEGMLGNGQNTMCSRILKAEPCSAFVRDLKIGDALSRMFHPGEPIEIIKVIGYSASEPKRVTRMVGRCAAEEITARFPVIEEKVTKQDTADWCQCTMSVKPSAMYEWAEHANCIGCVKGGKAYWLAVAENHPEVFEQRAQLEEEFGHSIIRGFHAGGHGVTLRELVQIGLKRKVADKERIEIGTCDCGD
jgi:hypothetical protein